MVATQTDWLIYGLQRYYYFVRVALLLCYGLGHGRLRYGTRRVSLLLLLGGVMLSEVARRRHRDGAASHRKL